MRMSCLTPPRLECCPSSGPVVAVRRWCAAAAAAAAAEGGDCRMAPGAVENVTRLENVTHTISCLLKNYDIRLRPNFGAYAKNNENRKAANKELRNTGRHEDIRMIEEADAATADVVGREEWPSGSEEVAREGKEDVIRIISNDSNRHELAEKARWRSGRGPSTALSCVREESDKGKEDKDTDKQDNNRSKQKV
ncbi:Protein of unknown function [Gryllus bimaculatus]|nr:Protein of unknown function [Gryllus bimaculatus]